MKSILTVIRNQQLDAYRYGEPQKKWPPQIQRLNQRETGLRPGLPVKLALMSV